MELKDFLNGKRDKIFCPHLHIGSSQFSRFMAGTLKPKTAHTRLAYKSCQSSGAEFEDLFSKDPVLMGDEGETYSFTDLRSQAFSYSKDFWFLAATPDFLGRYTDSLGNKRSALVEVKHTANRSTFDSMFASNENDATYQLMSALNIFGLQTGFLVVYLVDEENDEIETGFKIVESRGYFLEKRNLIIARYAEYLVKLLGTACHSPAASEHLKDEIEKYIGNTLTDFAHAKSFLTSKKDIPLLCPLSLAEFPPNFYIPKVGRPRTKPKVRIAKCLRASARINNLN